MATKRPSARERLLQTADRLFYAEGVHAVGIDRIIEEAGVAKGSLFYNFANKEALVEAYLDGRDQQRRNRVQKYLDGLEDPVEKILAVFDALQEVVERPDWNGCPFANANAEAPAGGMEARALKRFRGWMSDLLVGLAREAGFKDPSTVGSKLVVLYDGAVANSNLDAHPGAVRMARDMAAQVLNGADRDSGDRQPSRV